ncbi:CAP domain-containing protein [Staphylococcus pettenkoferi]|nr:CAP domain-containing protein [Staphylococcus pettenkoferi]ASE35996.1 secretion protein [Staphylococcus pettenkoferi]MCY1580053.1 CAP domain-containing protein [Staphylococcus pettenkoferi]MCY1620518.1 CAP domain-containing protein [Staphylococcus pettenkoferi]
MLIIKRLFSYVVLLLLLVLIIPFKEPDFLTQLHDNAQAKLEKWTRSTSVSNEALKVPSKQEFAVNNIQLNMTQSEVEKKLGKAQRTTSNEYGTKWYAYHDAHYKNFVMVSYLDHKVNALYTNQNLISSKQKLKYGSPKSVVRDKLGDPIKYKEKNHVRYEENNDGYDTFHKDNIYTTVFYDKHNHNNVTALLQVSDKMEQRLQSRYGQPSSHLARGFEQKNFDLINAERAQRGLNTLTFDDDIATVARKHSKDMADNNYFDHTNKSNQSPFDRLKHDGISFNGAGENIASGQQSSIYAHQGLMNSLGHRKNILRKEFKNIGVGVDFSDGDQPYWTENYTY